MAKDFQRILSQKWEHVKFAKMTVCLYHSRKMWDNWTYRQTSTLQNFQMAMTLYNPKCPLKYEASEDVYVFISNITTRTVQVH